MKLGAAAAPPPAPPPPPDAPPPPPPNALNPFAEAANIAAIEIPIFAYKTVAVVKPKIPFVATSFAAPTFVPIITFAIPKAVSATNAAFCNPLFFSPIDFAKPTNPPNASNAPCCIANFVAATALASAISLSAKTFASAIFFSLSVLVASANLTACSPFNFSINVCFSS